MEDGQKVMDPLMSVREETWGYYAVFDGHGGREEMRYCESKMHEVLLGELRTLSSNRDVSDALKNAFKKVDAQLSIMGAWNSGCTATVALAHRHPSGKCRLYVANVGDSRAVLATSAGAVRRASTDHRASDPAEVKRVESEGGVVRRGRVGGTLIVSRSLGDHHLKNSGVSCIPDVFVCDLPPGENALVIASDGLWDALEDEGAGELIRDAVNVAVQTSGQRDIAAALQAKCAQSLVAHAKANGSRDNILAMVVFL